MLSVIKEIISESFSGGKFQKNLKHHIFQSLLTFICVGIALLMHEFFGGIIVASLGASSCIIFITPHTNASKARCVVGGYVCGSIAGLLLGFLHRYVSSLGFYGQETALLIVCAASSAFCIFLMITSGLVHPPSAALALGLAADRENYKTALAAILGVMILCAARRLLRKYIKDLI